jgi:hypothetical protein
MALKMITEPDGDQGKRRPVIIDGMGEIWVYICPNDQDHYYASPDFTPRNRSLHDRQFHRNQNTGKIERSDPRINCPYCHVPRLPYLVKQLIPFEDPQPEPEVSQTRSTQ